MTKLEKDIERKLRDMVKRHGGLCLKWVCPGWAGVPDRIILLPGGRVMFVETKRSKDSKVSKLQLWWLDKLQSLGFVARLCFTLKDVQAIEIAIVLNQKEI